MQLLLNAVAYAASASGAGFKWYGNMGQRAAHSHMPDSHGLGLLDYMSKLHRNYYGAVSR
jgi:hypothetical protein